MLAARLYGKDSSHAAMTMAAMSSIHSNVGELVVAKSLSSLDVAMLERLGLTNTLQYAKTIHNLAAYVNMLGLNAEALALYERSLAIGRRLLPPTHPHLALSQENIARAQALLGDVAAANASIAASTAVARRSQVACAGPGCKLRLRPDGAPLDVCVSCRCTFYCGKACQTADWKAGHRAECKVLIAEAAAKSALDS